MLTQDEEDLYDRQIRLWGVNAQGRIRQSKVLMLGFNGTASEVAKILVLAGIDTLTIVDDQPLQSSDLSSNLFCRDPEPKYRTHAVQAKLRILNPLVKVNVDNSSILSKKPEDFKDYDLVTLHSFLTIDQTSEINDICRKQNIKFYVVLDYGFFGFMFNDLGKEFKFTYEEFNGSVEKENAVEVEVEVEDEEDRPKKRLRVHSPDRKEKSAKVGSLPYVTFKDMISLKSTSFSKQTNPVVVISIAMYRFYSQFDHLPRQDDLSKLNEIIVSLRDSLNLNDGVFKKLDKEWCEHIYGSLSPVCTVMGGVAGQDMIRALSSKDIPITNTFAFDGISMNGTVEKVGLPNAKAQPIVRDFLQIDDD